MWKSNWQTICLPFIGEFEISEGLYSLSWSKGDRWFYLKGDGTNDSTSMAKGPMILPQWRRDQWCYLNGEGTNDLTSKAKDQSFYSLLQSRRDVRFYFKLRGPMSLPTHARLPEIIPPPPHTHTLLPMHI
jgi:hypothetical protein